MRQIFISSVQEQFKVAKRTAGRDLVELVDSGLLEEIGTTGKGVHYRLTQRGHDWAQLNE